MTRILSISLAAFLALTLTGCPEDTPEPTFDADVLIGDAADTDGFVGEVGAPDADAIEPDADAIEPDADAIEPDAEVIEPDAEVIEPDAEVIEPDAEVIEPDAEVIEPDIVVPAKITFDAVHAIFSVKCAGCHTSGASGGHAMGSTAGAATGFTDSQKDAYSVTGTKGAAALVRIEAGEMPKGKGCSGDPTTDAGKAGCLTQAELDMLKAWLDDGQLAPL